MYMPLKSKMQSYMTGNLHITSKTAIIYVPHQTFFVYVEAHDLLRSLNIND